MLLLLLFEAEYTGFVVFCFQLPKEMLKGKKTTWASPISRNGEQCSNKSDLTMQGPPEQPQIVIQLPYVTSLFVSVIS